METMQEKYTHMHKKVESTRQTLHEAEDRIVRQDKIRETCKDLQERARNYEEKMRQRQESNAMFTAEIGDFDFPIPLIGKKYALKKYDQFALDNSCFWGSTGSSITPSQLCSFTNFLVTKIMNNFL